MSLFITKKKSKRSERKASEASTMELEDRLGETQKMRWKISIPTFWKSSEHFDYARGKHFYELPTYFYEKRETLRDTWLLIPCRYRSRFSI